MIYSSVNANRYHAISTTAELCSILECLVSSQQQRSPLLLLLLSRRWHVVPLFRCSFALLHYTILFGFGWFLQSWSMESRTADIVLWLNSTLYSPDLILFVFACTRERLPAGRIFLKKRKICIVPTSQQQLSDAWIACCFINQTIRYIEPFVYVFCVCTLSISLFHFHSRNISCRCPVELFKDVVVPWSQVPVVARTTIGL